MTKIQATVRGIILLAAAAVLGGCALGQSVRYTEANPQLTLQGDRVVAVIVHDQRADVLSDDVEPNWVGELRSIAGIPYDVTTDNEQPLADNMARALAKALGRRGFEATPLAVPYSATRSGVIQRAVNTGTERIVLLTLNRYGTDTYFGTSLNYDVRLSILDGQGNLLASRQWDGEDDIDEISVTEAFTRKIEQWFSAPKIVQALE